MNLKAASFELKRASGGPTTRLQVNFHDKIAFITSAYTLDVAWASSQKAVEKLFQELHDYSIYLMPLAFCSGYSNIFNSPRAIERLGLRNAASWTNTNSGNTCALFYKPKFSNNPLEKSLGADRTTFRLLRGESNPIPCCGWSNVSVGKNVVTQRLFDRFCEGGYRTVEISSGNPPVVRFHAL